MIADFVGLRPVGPSPLLRGSAAGAFVYPQRVPQLIDIRRYPLKSCRGESVESAIVEPWGLAGDRRWMLVDLDGRFISARENHSMLLIKPVLTANGLRVTAPHCPDLPPLDVPEPDARSQVAVSIWRSDLTAAPAATEVDAWFTRALGQPARLVFLDDPRRRSVSQEFGRPDDRVSFADGYPLLLTTAESLSALNDDVAATSTSTGRLSMVRFRPSVVVSGFPAWAEDDWRRIRIGEAVFRAVKGCARCVITTVDPETGERGKEPLATLARTRRWDNGVWFGINLVPDSPGATIRVGDALEIIEAVEPGNGPIRSAI